MMTHLVLIAPTVVGPFSGLDPDYSPFTFYLCNFTHENNKPIHSILSTQVHSFRPLFKYNTMVTTYGQ